MPSRWFVYLLRCRDGSLYTGITNDLRGRVAAHNAGAGAKYTRVRLPVRLAYSESARSRGAALRREAEIKKWSRRRKLAFLTAARKSVMLTGRPTSARRLTWTHG